MSNIDTSGIDTLYPQLGRDNSSAGFRTNFGSIASNLDIAKTELEDLQSKVLLKTALTGTDLDNNLNHNSLSNGIHKQFYPVYADRGFSTPTTTIDLNNGPVQKFTIHDSDVSGGDQFNWANWMPITQTASQCSSIRLMFKAETGSKTVSFTGPATIVPAQGLTLPLTVTSNHYTVIDAWSVNGGSTIYINLVGIF